MAEFTRDYVDALYHDLEVFKWDKKELKGQVSKIPIHELLDIALVISDDINRMLDEQYAWLVKNAKPL